MGCCGGPPAPPAYRLKLSKPCDGPDSELWEGEAPPTGMEPCKFRTAFDGNGCFYVRTGTCGAWRKVFTPGVTPVGDPDPPPPIQVKVNGNAYPIDENYCVELPPYPDTGTNTIDTDTHVTVKIGGIVIPEVDGCVDLPNYPVVGTPAPAVTVSLDGDTYSPDTNGVVTLPPYPSTTADLCNLVVSDDVSPCCNDYVAMCKGETDADGNVTGVAESALVPIEHIIGAYEASDIDAGVANTCNGQNFYVSNGDGTYSLFFNAGIPSGGTDTLVFQLGVV